MGRTRWVAAVAGWLLLALLAGAPLYALIWRAGRLGGMDRAATWSSANLARTLVAAAVEVQGPLAATAVAAATAAALASAISWSICWICRSSASRWPKALVILCAALSLAMPGPVAGFALKIAYLKVPPIHDTVAIVVLGQLMRVWPFALLILWPAVKGIPTAFLESAAVDGLGPIRLITWVAIPLTWTATLGAWGVCFVLAMGELPVTNVVSPPGFDAISTLLWQRLHFGVDSELAGIGLVLLLAYGAMGVGAWWLVEQIWTPGRRNA